MRNFLLSIAFFGVTFIGIKAQNTIRIDEKTDLKKIESELTAQLHKIDFLENVQNMDSFELYKLEKDILLLTGRGIEITKEGRVNNVCFRVAVVDGLLSAMGESCTGNNCEQCEFASKGGCSCVRYERPGGGDSYCNHTITKDFSSLLTKYRID